jgi:hypothetical protein
MLVTCNWGASIRLAISGTNGKTLEDFIKNGEPK